MANRNPSPEALLRASVGGQYTRLSKKLIGRLEPLFEGIGIDGKANSRKELLEGAQKIAQNMGITRRLESRERLNDIRAPECILVNSDNLVAGSIEQTAIVLRHLGRSSKPREYLGFISRPWSCREFFFHISGIFAAGNRRISLKDISPEKIAAGDRIAQLITGKERQISKMIETALNDQCEALFVENAVRFFRSRKTKQMSLNSTEEHNISLRNFGIYYADGQIWRFHRLFENRGLSIMLASNPEKLPRGYAGGSNEMLPSFLLASENEPDIQFGLQLGFDYYTNMPGTQAEVVSRAHYASTAFSAPLHAQAPNEDPETALKLLNAAYRQACGLSYDEILEPLRKTESS